MSKKLAHTRWECKYHIVWIPKCRRKVVYGKLRKEIGEIIRRLCDYKGRVLSAGLYEFCFRGCYAMDVNRRPIA